MTEPRFPQLVIVGAPRCATTSLYRWLTAQPDVSGRAKDSYYLMDTTSGLKPAGGGYHTHGLEGYSKGFTRQAKRYVDAGAGYLYQDTALSVFAALPVIPYIVTILRDPVDRLYSAYHYGRGNAGLIPEKVKFEEFVHAQLEGIDPVPGAPDETYCQAVDQGMYAKHISRWRDRLGFEQVVLVDFDELSAEPARVTARLLSVIGLTVDPLTVRGSFERHNSAVEVRSRQLHRWSRTLADHLPKGPLREATGRMYRRLNARSVIDTASSENMIIQLRDFYRPSVVSLVNNHKFQPVWATHYGI